MYTWGHGLGGRLGHGSEDDEPLPRRVEALAAQHVRAIAAGEAREESIEGALREAEFRRTLRSAELVRQVRACLLIASRWLLMAS